MNFPKDLFPHSATGLRICCVFCILMVMYWPLLVVAIIKVKMGLSQQCPCRALEHPEHWTSSTLFTGCSIFIGVCQTRSTSVLWIWKRHLIVLPAYLVGECSGSPVPGTLYYGPYSTCMTEVGVLWQGCLPFVEPGPPAWFAPKCEATGMRICISKSEAMVLQQKKVACPLRVGGETLPQVKEFKDLGVLFAIEVKLELELDR